MTKFSRIPQSIFGDISVDQFLTEFWQKKPLFVRGAWPGFYSPVNQESMIGLACREDAESRIIIEQGGSYPWEALFGPFEPEDFNELPNSHWTLLVQEVDRLIPEISHLLDALPFLSNWRFDDIMVSLAANGGGVGAHIDEYDVFLFQGEGSRLWQIDANPVSEEVLIPDLDVRILANFTPTHEWTVEQGDLLYLPPRFAHYGVAVGSCITYSIGCRTPSGSDLVSAFLEHYLSTRAGTSPFKEDSTSTDAAVGLVHPNIKSFARETLLDMIENESFIDRWLGRYLSKPGRGNAPDPPESTVDHTRLNDHLRTGGVIRTVAPSQVLFDLLESGDLILYAGGSEYTVHPDLASVLERLTGRSGLRLDDANSLSEYPEFIQLVVALINEGFFALETTP